MKSILLHIHDDDALESRLQVALDLARRGAGHLTCLQASPVQSYALASPMGGFFAGAEIAEELVRIDTVLREKITARLEKEDVHWDWIEGMGDAAHTLITASALQDVLVLSQRSVPVDKTLAMPPMPIVDDVAVHARCATLVVPPAIRQMPTIGPAVIGWNGSVEGAHALRQSLSLLAAAPRIDIISVGKDEGEFPQEAASVYLARHGIASTLHVLKAADGSVANTLHTFAEREKAGFILIGAYTRSRFREALMGGVTRDLLTGSRIPLLLGH
jgi:nucleotide-binding universal stress UspA family protein